MQLQNTEYYKTVSKLIIRMDFPFYFCFVSQTASTFAGWIWEMWKWWPVCWLVLPHAISAHVYKTHSLCNSPFQAMAVNWEIIYFLYLVLKLRHSWRWGLSNTVEHCPVNLLCTKIQKSIYNWVVFQLEMKWRDVFMCFFTFNVSQWIRLDRPHL